MTPVRLGGNCSFGSEDQLVSIMFLPQPERRDRSTPEANLLQPRLITKKKKARRKRGRGSYHKEESTPEQGHFGHGFDAGNFLSDYWHTRPVRKEVKAEHDNTINQISGSSGAIPFVLFFFNVSTNKADLFVKLSRIFQFLLWGRHFRAITNC